MSDRLAAIRALYFGTSKTTIERDFDQAIDEYSNAIGAPHSVSLTGTGCRFFTMRAARSGQALCGP